MISGDKRHHMMRSRRTCRVARKCVRLDVHHLSRAATGRGPVVRERLKARVESVAGRQLFAFRLNGPPALNANRSCTQCRTVQYSSTGTALYRPDGLAGARPFFVESAVSRISVQLRVAKQADGRRVSLGGGITRRPRRCAAASARPPGRAPIQQPGWAGLSWLSARSPAAPAVPRRAVARRAQTRGPSAGCLTLPSARDCRARLSPQTTQLVLHPGGAAPRSASQHLPPSQTKPGAHTVAAPIAAAQERTPARRS